MFAITTHFRAAEDLARQQSNAGVALVLLTGLSAIIAGLLIEAMSSLSAFTNLVPV